MYAMFNRGTCEKGVNYAGSMFAKLLQLCPTLWDTMDCSQPGSSVHGILQAGILEWVVVSSSRDPSFISYV